MLRDWLSRLEPVHKATTRSEREAIYRFRYTVFVKELGREIGGVDHDQHWVCDEEDEKPYTIHAYTGTIENITGSMRLRHWEPGAVPQDEQRLFSMERVPGIEIYAVAELDRLMISRTLRGRLILPSMARTMYELLVGEMGTDLIFCCCAPGLVRHYRKIGLRPYRAKMIHSPEGMRIPLMGVPSDLDYAKSQGSMLAPLTKKYFGRGKRAPIDLEPFADLFEGDNLMIELDPGKAWEKMQEEILLEDQDLPSFLDSLPEKVVKRLCDKGFVLDIPDGTLLTREGFSEQEMYVVLSGSFEVLQGDRRIALAHKGDLLGEVAFFRESGKRSASIRALGNARVLLLRRRLVEELGREDPDAAYQILLNLGRVLSERLISKDPGSPETL
jgi:hypothetical protein